MSYISEFNESVMETSQIIADNIFANTATITAASIPTLVSTSITATSINANNATIATASIPTLTSTIATITTATIPALTGTDAAFETITVSTNEPFIDIGCVQFAGWNQFDIKEGASTGNRMRHYINVTDDPSGRNYKITGLYDSDIATVTSTNAILGFGSLKFSALPDYIPFITAVKGDASGYAELRLSPNIDGTPGRVSIGAPFTRTATNALEVVGVISSDAMIATTANYTTASITTGTISTLVSGTFNCNTGTANTFNVSTSLLATNGNITSLGNTTFNSTFSTITNATIGSLSNTTASIGTLSVTNATLTNATCSSLRIGTSNVIGSGANLYTIPALATSDFVMTEGAQTINGAKTFTNLSSGTYSASSATITTALIGSLTSTTATITTGSVGTLTSTTTNITTLTCTTATITNATCSSLRVGTATVVGSGTNSYTIPALAASSFIMSEGTQTINGAKTLTSSTTFNGGITSANATIPVGKSLNITANNSAIPGIQMTLAASSSLGLRIDAPSGNSNAILSVTQAASNVSQNFIQMQNGTFSTFIRTAVMGGPRIHTIPEVSASADFIMSQGAQTLSGVKTFASNPVMSSLTASQAVVTNGSKNLTSLAYTSNNTPSTIVSRDASGNFTTGLATLETGIVLPNPTALSTFTLDHYEEFDYPGTNAWTGPWATAQSGVLKCVRVGKLVTLYFPQVTAAATIAAVITFAGGPLKAWHTPTNATYGPASISNNLGGFSADGRVVINTGITIGSTNLGAAFSGSGTNGFINFSITYLVD